ncbi:hypothetical protein [Fusobacterium sp. PH5-44]|uniref:hypothetical protein n=1 Tax=unclassified Fusobacterium TaxID=2648384 RepID=UPI003D206F10
MINGIIYEAPIPDEKEVILKLKELFQIKSVTKRALEYYIWGIKSQLFEDGNKRTSNIIANAIFIKEGKGIVTVSENDIKEFNNELTEYYKTDDSRKLKKFFYEKCIKGLDINKTLEKKHKLSWNKTMKKEKDSGNEL